MTAVGGESLGAILKVQFALNKESAELVRISSVERVRFADFGATRRGVVIGRCHSDFGQRLDHLCK